MSAYTVLNSHLFLCAVVCFIYGPSAVLSSSCTDGEIITCVTGMGKLDFNDAKTTCKALKAMEYCLGELEGSCKMSDVQINLHRESKKQIDSINHMCQTTKDECNSKATGCMIPYENVYNTKKEAAKLCSVMLKTSTCLKQLVPDCNNQQTKRDLESSINGIAIEASRLKCKDQGHTITGVDGEGKGKKPANSGDTSNTSGDASKLDGNNLGIALQPTAAIFLLSTVLIMLVNHILTAL